MIESHVEIKAIIGLGNPGKRYYNNRHSIGFRVLDALAEKYNSSWTSKENMEIAEISINNHQILLIKPQTFMNSSGKVIPYVLKKGIKDENILVVHDELELPFGQIKIKKGGSAKGHNGLKSIIQNCSEHFYRLRFGIGRPAEREQVPEYVLEDFSEEQSEVEHNINKSIAMIEQLVNC